MNIIYVLSRYHLKLPNDFKEGGIMAIVRPKPPRILILPKEAKFGSLNESHTSSKENKNR
jgi:hypothetical protein